MRLEISSQFPGFPSLFFELGSIFQSHILAFLSPFWLGSVSCRVSAQSIENGLIEYARENLATLHVIDGDHRLTDNIEEINLYLENFLNSIYIKA